MVAGGVGQTPFLTLAKEHLGHRKFGQPPRLAPRVPKVTLCFGAQSRDLLAGVHDSNRKESRCVWRPMGSVGSSRLGHRDAGRNPGCGSKIAAIARGAPRGLLRARADDAGRGGSCHERTESPASFPWKPRWHVGLGSVSRAWPKSANPRGKRGITSGRVSKGRSSMPNRFAGDSAAAGRSHTARGPCRSPRPAGAAARTSARRTTGPSPS